MPPPDLPQLKKLGASDYQNDSQVLVDKSCDLAKPDLMREQVIDDGNDYKDNFAAKCAV